MHQGPEKGGMYGGNIFNITDGFGQFKGARGMISTTILIVPGNPNMTLQSWGTFWVPTKHQDLAEHKKLSTLVGIETNPSMASPSVEKKRSLLSVSPTPIPTPVPFTEPRPYDDPPYQRSFFPRQSADGKYVSPFFSFVLRSFFFLFALAFLFGSLPPRCCLMPPSACLFADRIRVFFSFLLQVSRRWLLHWLGTAH